MKPKIGQAPRIRNSPPQIVMIAIVPMVRMSSPRSDSERWG
jgi:hypothetical protein